MHRLLAMALGAAVLTLGFADGAAADEGYRGKRVRVGKVNVQRGAVVARSYVPYVGYWRPPQPEPPSGPPGVATVYAYPLTSAPLYRRSTLAMRSIHRATSTASRAANAAPGLRRPG